MPNSNEFRVRWEKVESGLRMAKIDAEGITFLTNRFNEIPREYAEQVLEGGSSAMFNRSAELKTNRDLFRAFNFIAAIRAKRGGLQYGTNVKTREQFWDIGTDRMSLEKIIQDEYRELKKEAQIQDALFAQIKIPIQPQPAPPAIPPASPRPPSPRVKRIDDVVGQFNNSVLPELRRAIEVKSVKIEQGEIRAQQAKDQARNAWFRAKQELYDTFAETRLNQVFEFTRVISTVDESFNWLAAVIKANNEGIKKRLELVGKLLTALIPEEPPFKYFAKAIETGIGLFEPGTYNPHRKFVALKGSNASRFSKVLAEVMEGYEQVTSLSSLKGLNNVGDFKDGVSAISRALLAAMRDVTKTALDRTFGSDTNDAIFDAVYTGYLSRTANTRSNPPGQTELARAQTFIKQEVEANKVHIKDVIESHLTYAWNGDEAEALGVRLRMGMVCAYLIETFDGSKLGFKFPIDSEIVQFLASGHEWGILMLNASRRTSDQRLRINWDGEEDHKKALLLFCRWYVKNINPFHILVNGPAGAKRIQERCEQHILLINQAINSGRGQVLLWERWDWGKIGAAYEGACAGTGAQGWEKIDIWEV